MRKQKARRGFSLIELLIAIVVLSIIGAITAFAGISAQRRARITSAMTVFDNYKNAFNTALMDHPGMVNDRYDDFTAKDGSLAGTVYTSVSAYEKLVGLMNRSLSDELQLSLNSSGLYYESAGEDPWGGKYVLHCYPEKEGVTDYWYFGEDGSTDPSRQALAIANKSTMRVSIWCSGLDSDIILPDSDGRIIIRDISVGIGLVDEAGTFTYTTHGGSDNVLAYKDHIIRSKHIQP